jgi:hypothetical protein
VLKPPRVATAALVLLWIGVSAWLAIWFSGRIRDWSVMTDELLYAKLATSIADTGSPLPRVHGMSIEVYNQLYPLLIAPLYGALSPPEAFRAAHVLNAMVMASAVFPVYLLGRQILPRAWSVAVAGLAVLVPWMVLTGFVMTESAAYPAFAWALLGLQVAIAAPSPRRDLLAVAALLLAVLARTQFAVLVLVLPLGILGHELLRSSDTRRRERMRNAVRDHRVLAVLYAAGAILALILALAGSLGSLLGVYGVTVEEGSLLPSGIWSSAARHLDAVAIGSGLLPLVLGGGWMLATLVRPSTTKAHVLATLSVVTIVLITFEAASFSVRFGDGAVRDRYLFYVVPLLLIGAAAALHSVETKRVALGAAAVAVFFAATASQLPFTVYEGVWVDSPASVLNGLLIEQSGELGTGTFVALLGLFTGLVAVLALLLAPRTPFALFALVALLAFSVLTLRSEVDRIVTASGLSGRPLAGSPGLVLDWVDTVVPDGEGAALVAFPVSTAWDTTAIRWWDVEFWNRSVTRGYVAGDDGNFRYTPFPHRGLEVDWATGEVAGTDDAPPYVVAAPGDSRFQLAGRDQAANLGFVVRAVERPYRALWATKGLQTDGWTTPARPVTIRVYGGNRRELVVVRIQIRAPALAPATYRLLAEAEARVGSLAAGKEKTESVRVCLPARSTADLTLASSSSTTIEGVPLSPEIGEPRRVGVNVGAIAIQRVGTSCVSSRR